MISLVLKLSMALTALGWECGDTPDRNPPPEEVSVSIDTASFHPIRLAFNYIEFELAESQDEALFKTTVNEVASIVGKTVQVHPVSQQLDFSKLGQCNKIDIGGSTPVTADLVVYVTTVTGEAQQAGVCFVDESSQVVAGFIKVNSATVSGMHAKELGEMLMHELTHILAYGSDLKHRANAPSCNESRNKKCIVYFRIAHKYD